MGISRIVVFAGPSLPDFAAWPAGVEPRHPARRGDLLALQNRRDSLVLLVDGAFFQNPAVTHYELLTLLRAEIPLWGAASMGALRAAELRHNGMMGVGCVYRAIVEGLILDDSEVATAMSPFTYEAVSVPLVEIRALFALAAETALDAAQLERAFETSQRIHFLERTEARLFAEWSSVSDGIAADLRRLWLRPEWRVKSLDAAEAIASAVEKVYGEPSGIGSRQGSFYIDGEVITV